MSKERFKFESEKNFFTQNGNMIRKLFLPQFLLFLIANFILVCPLKNLQAFNLDNFPDNPKELLLNEPSSFVNNSVNVITGNYHENELDLEVAGPHPLFLQRSYASNLFDGNLAYQWHTNHFGCICYRNEGISNVVDDYGICVSYIGSSAKKRHLACCSVNNEIYQKFVTNNPDVNPVGSHIQNNRLFQVKKDRVMFIKTGHGYTRHYKYLHGIYFLESEEQPNNSILSYSAPEITYAGKRQQGIFKPSDRKISLKNRAGYELSNIDSHRKDDYEQFTGSDGRWVRYHYGTIGSRQESRRYLHLVNSSDHPIRAYEYDSNNLSLQPKIWRKNLPDGRYVCNHYYKVGDNQNGIIHVDIGESDPLVGRVMCQMAPVGVDANPVVTHRYFYNLIKEIWHEYDEYGIGEFGYNCFGGNTIVYDANNNKTEYHFNNDFRLTDIVKWKDANNQFSVERLKWGGTNLMSRTLENEKMEVKVARTYSYDRFGNVTQTCYWGNLSGRHFGAFLFDGNRNPIPGCTECHTKTSTYTTEVPYRLLSESDGKKTIEYGYWPNTNLISTRLVKANNKIHKREFTGYDLNGCLQSFTVDDGSSGSENDPTSVTERRITLTQNRTIAPIGLPHIVDQYCLDCETIQNCLLGRVINNHSLKGQLLSQEHYDSELALKFTLEWDYDAKGNLSMEKDALGRVVKRRYDDNKNLVYEEGPLPGVYKEFRYDFVNRLIGTTEVHPDGIRLTCSFRYDLLGNKIASIDPYGNETRYVYDNLNRLIKTILPAVVNENNVLSCPETHVEYDLFNNPCRITDSIGGVTTVAYTAYNKPYHKTYPDGTTEKFEYDLTGNLILSTAQNGAQTIYQYDPFDRLIKKDVYSSSGTLLQTESKTYDTFHLRSETDPSGMTTSYQYDKAGRLASMTKGEMLTKYKYDTLGRESQILTFYGADKDQYSVKAKEYDLLNRVIEERAEDSFGNVLIKETYEYDLAGNCSAIKKFNQSGESVTRTEYNTRNQPILLQNAIGEQTHIVYRFDYYNEELSQYLPYCESTAPNGVVSVTIKDALGRTKTEYKKDPYGVLLQKRHFYYTLKGSLAKTVDEVIIDGVVQREIINICRYNTADKLIETYESEGTPEQKITKFTYDSYGRKESEIKPDGICIQYEYDALGRLEQYYSSDKSIHYIYEYDPSSNPKRIVDKINGTETYKTFDGYNRLIKETLGNGLSSEYSYDLAGKATKMLFPDGSGMEMSYESLLLKEVSRLNQAGIKLYSHSYDAYDMAGNVTENTLIGKAGKTKYTIDLQGRMSEMDSEAWSGSILNYDNSGNVSSKTTRDQLGCYSSDYNYDKLDQLNEESGSLQQNYAYDSLYNRIRKGGIDHKVNNINQITYDGKNDYGYDLNGNLTRIKNETSESNFYYDALNRLVKVEIGDQQVVYVYDEMNRRIGKTISVLNEQSQYIPLKSFKYFYQAQNEIGCWEDGKITELRLLGIGKGAEIGAAVAMEFDGTAYAPIHDLHGNVICLVEAETGKVKEFYRYSAFGEELLYDQTGARSKEVLNPWRFSSKRTDSETGFVYFGRRYYDSELGRWITPDPIGFQGGPNLYAFVMNSPLTHVDLYGLYAVDSNGGSSSERNCFTGVREFATAMYECVRDCITTVVRSIRDGLCELSSRMSERFRSYNEQRQVKFSEKMFSSFMNRLPSSGYIMGEGAYAGLTYEGGINNTANDNFISAEIISDLSGGYQVETSVNPSNGFWSDLCRVFHSLHHYVASNAVPEILEKINRHFSREGLWMPMLITCHSEGTTNVRNALMCCSPEIRQWIDVLAIAPSGYIDAYLCRSVHHYVSTRDFVPSLDSAGKARNTATTHTLKAHKDASFWDHSFDSPTYTEAIKYHVNQHLKEYGY